MATTYKQLLDQAGKLMRKAETVRKKEIGTVVAEIRTKMTEYGISLKDLGAGGLKKHRRGRKAKVAAKYREPASGQTWSGRGRTPKWLQAAEATGKRRESFSVSESQK